jgi:hypothetical protein
MSTVNLLPLSTLAPFAAQPAAGAPARTEIAFVLNNVADWQALAAGVRPGVQVVVLDGTGDGLAQMVDYLAQKTPGSVDAIHLLGHGSSGSLNLGALTLNTDNLQEQAATLAQIGGALTAQGDWLLYGCNVAEGAAGVSLLGQLAQFSGADVAASSDATGATALGGDWVLEAASGDINASLLTAQAWRHSLAIASFSPADNSTNVAAGLTPLVVTMYPLSRIANQAIMATSFYFIDASLPDLSTLLAGLPSGVEVHLLPEGRDGLKCIADTLLGRSGIEALHLITHGAPGQLHIGNSTLSSANLADYGDELNIISNALVEDGQWLIYGCEVAARGEGYRFINQLSIATGLQVFAASHKVGHADLGGRWALDKASHMDMMPSSLEICVPSWRGVLIVPVTNITLSLPTTGSLWKSSANLPTASVFTTGNPSANDSSSGISGTYFKSARADTNHYTVDIKATAGGTFDIGTLYGVNTGTNTDIIVLKGLDASGTQISGMSKSVSYSPVNIDAAYSSTESILNWTGITTLQVYAINNLGGDFYFDSPSFGAIAAPFGLSSSSPADNATAVAVGSNIVLTFSENVAAGTGNIVISDGTDTRTIAVGDAQVSISGATVTINPTADLNPNSTYYVQMASGVITSSTSTPFAGISDTTTLNFTTGVSDAIAPTISSVSSSTADGTYKAGDVIAVTVLFSEVVTVTGTPQLTLATGTTDRIVNYASGSGSNTLIFSYTVQAGDTSADLDYLSTTALALNSGTIKDGAGNDSILTLATPAATNSLGANKAIIIDTTAAAPALTLAVDTGSSTSDTITNNSLVNVSGLETGATWQYSTDAGSNWSSGTGSSFTVSGDGAKSVTVRQTDAAGNTSSASTALAFTLDTTPPTFDAAPAAGTATAINENSGAGQTVYTAAATDAGAITYSLKAATDDVASFSINASTGAVSLTGNPDFEAKPSYSFTVVATDAANNASEKAVTLAINDQDEVAPVFTSAATATAINENSAASQTVYTAAATDTGAISYSLKPGIGDVSLFSINATTGAVTLTASPNFEAKSSYSFTVVATDAGNNFSEKAVTLAINNLDEAAPDITSGATATAINENSGAGQVVYTATSTDAGDTATGSTTYSLKAATGDVAAFSINASTGAVTLTGNPNFEAKPSYSFTVVATDAANNASEKAVTLAINNLDEAAPVITSGTTATAIAENSGAGQVVYTAAATDAGAITYSLKAATDDVSSFSINASTGAVTLTGNPDFETKASYSFTVVATDAANNASEQAVTLAINNLDESAPTITSAASATAINENSGATQVVYTATSTDTGDTATGATTYSLKAATGDVASFSINASTGAVTLTGNPDFETKASYSFTVVATDAANNASEQAVTLAINNLDESAPTITSAASATAINENSGATQVVYTATSTDTGDTATGATTYSLKAATGDVSSFSINASTGAVTLTGNPDFETKASYSFTVVATDAANNASEQAVTLAINNLNEAPSGSVVLQGTNLVGAVLTATNTLTDEDGMGSISYQWRAGGVPITGATGNSFLLGADQIGKTITVVATYTDFGGSVESVVSNESIAVLPTSTVTDTNGITTLVPPTDGVVQVLKPVTGSTVTSVGSANTVVTNPGTSVTLNNIGTGTTTTSGITDSTTLTITGTGTQKVDLSGMKPGQVLTIDNTGTGTVDLSNLPDGVTVKLLGTGPVVLSDSDGASGNVENTAPTLTGGQVGDGNGDGTPDALQTNVASVSFLKTDAAQTNPSTAAPVFVSLVADAKDGKIDTADTNTANLSNVRQLDAPANLPVEVKNATGADCLQRHSGFK